MQPDNIDNFHDNNTKNSNEKRNRIIEIVIGSIMLIGGVYLMIIWAIPRLKEDLAKKNTVTPTQISVTPEQKTLEGISPGIYISMIGNKKTNNTLPTIIGKSNHYGENLILDADYVLEENPINGEKEYFLHFIPGKVKLLNFKLDGEVIEDVYGFSQYPTVRCSIDTSQTTIKFNTKRDCILANIEKLPPVIFLYKPDKELSEGNHKFEIAYDDVQSVVDFSIEQNLIIPKQTIPEYSISNIFQMLDTNNNCYSGYYYNSEFIRLPLPKKNYDNILYQILFPQSDNEKDDANKIVKIKFSDQLYDLFFPDSLSFYNESIPEYGMDPLRALYLPEENLYYSNGEKSQLWKYEDKQENSQYSYSHEYFELLPIDITGRMYINNIIPFETVSWSGCDG